VNGKISKAGEMNPLLWKLEHQIGLIVAVIMGIPVGIIVGYIIHALGWGADAATFGFWIERPVRYGAIWWGMFGAGIGAGIIYTRQLLRA
jgi:hypothetical protein